MRHQRIFKNLVRHATLQPANSFGSPIADLNRKGLALVSFLLLALFSATALARADDQVRAVRLSNVVGSVQILAGAETQFSQAYPNMPLMQGSTLKTGEDGRAEIQLEDGSVIRLTPNSSVAMSVLGRDSAGNTKTEAEVLTGLTYVEMKGTANQRFVVHFAGNDVISPTPVKFRVNLDANPKEFAVLDGAAHLSSGAAYAIDVKMNETVRFDASDSSRYFLAQSVDPDSWDQWNLDRDQVMGQMAAQETREAIGSGNGNVAGMSDLDYYGNWYAQDDGSSFWVPDGAGAGWDPYGSGYWGYYGATGGYVWISGYPWGWLPYHCGTWNYFNTMNSWGWIPGGGCWNTWYPVGGFGNVPPRYHRLPRPNPPGHPLPGGGLHPLNRGLIAVDRGPEATTLTPRAGAAPRSIAVNGGEARLLPKTANPTSTMVYGRPGLPAWGRVGAGYSGGAQIGSAPVYRPSAPSVGSRPVGTSFGGQAGGGGASSARFSAPSAPSMSSGSHMSAGPAPSAGASSGGGHVR